LFEWIKNTCVNLFKVYRKFLHFTIFTTFSYCDYKVIWLIKEKLLSNASNTTLDPSYHKGLDVEKLAEMYFNNEDVRSAFGELDFSNETLVKYEIIKKLDKLEVYDKLTKIEKNGNRRGDVKYMKFNLKWKAYPIRYSVGAIITFIFFHFSEFAIQLLKNLIFG